MRLFPRPSDLLHAASSVRDGVSEAVDDVSALWELIGRAARLMSRAEELLTAAERSLVRAEVVLDEAESVTRGAAATVLAAGEATRRAEELVGTGERLLEPVGALSDQALPLAGTVVESIEEGEIRAVVRAIDHIPALVQSLERDIMPILGQLEAVGPDVHAILDSMTDLSHAVQGLPGVSLLQRRGERKEEEEEEEQQLG